MRLFARQQFAHLALFATLARCVLACGADSDHAPPIGSPTPGPIVEQGGSPSGGSTGRPGDGLGGGPATIGTGGNSATLGTGGDASFAGNGSGGNTFGSGGSATASNPFGVGGTSSGFSGGF